VNVFDVVNKDITSATPNYVEGGIDRSSIEICLRIRSEIWWKLSSDQLQKNSLENVLCVLVASGHGVCSAVHESGMFFKNGFEFLRRL